MQAYNPNNQRLVQQLLQRREERRLNPTNVKSFCPDGYYNTSCLYACEYRYYLGAIMVATYPRVVNAQNIDEIVERSYGVGPKVRAFILQCLEEANEME